MKIHRKNTEATAKAAQLLRAASGDFARPADYKGVPCTMALRVLGRSVEKLAEKRDEVSYHLKQTFKAGHTAVVLESSDVDARLADLDQASHLLRAARSVLEGRLRAARNTRAWVRKSCKVRR